MQEESEFDDACRCACVDDLTIALGLLRSCLASVKPRGSLPLII